MEKEFDYIISIKKQLDNCSWDFERKEIISNAVKNLKAKGYNDLVIKKLFQVSVVKEQDNSQMVNNNSRYLALLDEILNS
jgi:hypothetical protein